jgi:hypothetical protein
MRLRVLDQKVNFGATDALAWQMRSFEIRRRLPDIAARISNAKRLSVAPDAVRWSSYQRRSPVLSVHD